MPTFEHVPANGPDDLNLLRLASDEPSIFVALGTNSQDPYEPTGITLFGFALDKESLVRSVRERLHPEPDVEGMWSIGNPYPKGKHWGSVYVIEVPQNFPVMNLTLDDLYLMPKLFEKLQEEHGDTPSGPSM